MSHGMADGCQPAVGGNRVGRGAGGADAWDHAGTAENLPARLTSVTQLNVAYKTIQGKIRILDKHGRIAQV